MLVRLSKTTHNPVYERCLTATSDELDSALLGVWPLKSETTLSRLLPGYRPPIQKGGVFANDRPDGGMCEDVLIIRYLHNCEKYPVHVS